uniref:PYD and CARD domain containing n=1 Tax=Amphilophus citrinellus TaxID=61819 RepID=A0A3Q0T8B5_AMPCI
MPPKTIKSALAEALDDLSKADFEKFCHKLLDRRQEPRVKRSKVEDKSRLQITDVLVSHFTEEGALQVAVEILKEIDCCEEAKPLGKTKSSVPRFSDGITGHFVDKHRLDLIRRVSNISPILDELYDNEVVDQEVYDRIRALPTSQDKMRELYRCSMNAEKAKDIFYKILLANEKFLIEELVTKK